MNSDKDMGARLREARIKAGYETATEAARALGVAYPTYAGHENGHRGLRAHVEVYARKFGVPLEWLINGGKLQEPASKRAPLPDAPNAVVSSRIEGPITKIPLYGSAVGGEDGEFVLNGNHLDDIMAPPMLAAVNGAYAVTVAGDSMEPRYFDGEVVFVDPKRRVSRGDFVIAQVRHKNDGEAPYAYVKRFVRHTQTELVLEQYNPPKELRFPHADVVSVHFVVMGGRAG